MVIDVGKLADFEDGDGGPSKRARTPVLAAFCRWETTAEIGSTMERAERMLARKTMAKQINTRLRKRWRRRA